jgi:hypothetical protein
MGVFRMITGLAQPAERVGLVAAMLVVAYLAFSVPALIASVATTNVGLQSTTLVYSAALVALSAAATTILLLRPADKRKGDEMNDEMDRRATGAIRRC